MPDNTFNTFEEQLRAAAHDIVAADLATAPAASPADAAAIVAASRPAPAEPSRRILPSFGGARGMGREMLPSFGGVRGRFTVAAAAACLVVGYVLPHPAQPTSEADRQQTVRVETVERVRVDTVYRDRIVPQTVERIVERPVIQTVEVVREVNPAPEGSGDVVDPPSPATPPRHAPRSLANDGFIYAFNTIDE